MFQLMIFLFQQQPDTSAAADTLSLAAEQDSMSIFGLLAEGGVLMIPLFVLSLLAVYVIAERWRFLNNSRIEIDGLIIDY